MRRVSNVQDPGQAIGANEGVRAVAGGAVVGDAVAGAEADAGIIEGSGARVKHRVFRWFVHSTFRGASDN